MYFQVRSHISTTWLWYLVISLHVIKYPIHQPVPSKFLSRNLIPVFAITLSFLFAAAITLDFTFLGCAPHKPTITIIRYREVKISIVIVISVKFDSKVDGL